VLREWWEESAGSLGCGLKWRDAMVQSRQRDTYQVTRLSPIFFPSRRILLARYNIVSRADLLDAARQKMGEHNLGTIAHSLLDSATVSR
jgi:hypothetical protein